MFRHYCDRKLYLNRFILGALAFLLLSISCKSKKTELAEPDPIPTPTPTPTPTDTIPRTGTRDERTRDSIYLYAQQVYYWQDAIPAESVFKPRSFTKYNTPLANFEDELFKITQYKVNPSTGLPYEYVSATAGYPKYSYIDDVSQQNPTAFVKQPKSSVDLNNNGNDFGLRLGVEGTANNNYKLYIQMVYPNSPAEKAGLKRGDYITVVNGTSLGSNYPNEFDIFYTALFESSSATISGKRRDNTTFTGLVLNKASYASSPFLKDSVYTSGNKKIGYLAYARFANPTTSGPLFNAIFTKFNNAGVTDLIIDLRYNGGGYVSTAERLINLIAPSSLSGGIMFTEYYNTLMQQNKSKGTAPLLAKQYILDANDNKTDQNSDGKWDTYADIDFSSTNSGMITRFSKNGLPSTPSINRVAIITTRSTASASELVINALKPHFSGNIKVIGEKSYGKPVGFFPIRIDKYDVYFSMFETKNSLGSGGYYDGFTPDIAVDELVFNATNYDTWDINDYAFKAALNFIKGTATSSILSTTNASGAKFFSNSGKDLENFEFKGMIENRIKIK